MSDAADSLHLPSWEYCEGGARGHLKGAAGGSSGTIGSVSELCCARDCWGMLCTLGGKTTRTGTAYWEGQSRGEDSDIPEGSMTPSPSSTNPVGIHQHHQTSGIKQVEI